MAIRLRGRDRLCLVCVSVNLLIVCACDLAEPVCLLGGVAGPPCDHRLWLLQDVRGLRVDPHRFLGRFRLFLSAAAALPLLPLSVYGGAYVCGVNRNARLTSACVACVRACVVQGRSCTWRQSSCRRPSTVPKSTGGRSGPSCGKCAPERILSTTPIARCARRLNREGAKGGRCSGRVGGRCTAEMPSYHVDRKLRRWGGGETLRWYQWSHLNGRHFARNTEIFRASC